MKDERWERMYGTKPLTKKQKWQVVIITLGGYMICQTVACIPFVLYKMGIIG